jgi:hypothetical protein
MCQPLWCPSFLERAVAYGGPLVRTRHKRANKYEQSEARGLVQRGVHCEVEGRYDYPA